MPESTLMPESTMCNSLIRTDDRQLLLRLLGTPTVSPLEAGPEDGPPELWRAQHEYARAAEAIGLEVVHHASPRPDVVVREDVPGTVRRAAKRPDFLKQQPSLVLRLGPELPVESTVMFNVHLDTVAGLSRVGFDGERFTGRGAIDAKGPATALLSGIRAAVDTDGSIGREVAVLIQAVSGEEGGAMGTFGTRPLVEAGYFGRLNFFCEPTGSRYLPRATASMTACLRVDGQGSIDDRPEAGHNATIVLGFLAQYLAVALDPGDGRLCVAGLHTGEAHNRVYGSGRLLLNLSYTSAPARLEKTLVDAVDAGLRAFEERFAGIREFDRTARAARAITSLEWQKRGLPTLDNADPLAECLLREAGVDRWPDAEPAFTCDAIWMGGLPGTFTAVLGPGSLAGNNAHADGEYAELADLEEFAATVSRILTGFAQKHRARKGTPHDT